MLSHTFYGIPNDIVTGTIFIIALFFAVLLLRLLYFLATRPHQYPSNYVYTAVQGMRALKGLTIAAVLVIALLSFRINYNLNTVNFFSLDAISRNWWCAIRIIIACINACAAQVFDSHPFFRIFCSLTSPMLAVLDICSESSLSMSISCIEHGLCFSESAQLDHLYLYAWRDIVSGVITLMVTFISWWLWFQLGIFTNDLYMPRKEHRTMMKLLDGMKSQLQSNNNLRRRRNLEQENIGKMVGM